MEITPAGAAVLRRSDEILAEAEGELFTHLSPAEQLLLRDLLNRINVSPDQFTCTED